MDGHAEVLSFIIDAHDRATRVLRAVSAETRAMAEQMQASLRMLEAENVKLGASEKKVRAEFAETAAVAETSGKRMATGSRVAAEGSAALAAQTGRTGAAARRAAADQEHHGQAVSGVGNRLRESGRRTEEFGRSMSGLTIPILAVGAVSGKMALDFESAMTLLHTQARAPQAEVDRLRDKVLDLAPKVGRGPKELADALFPIESVGIRDAKALDVLKQAAIGANVGGADLTATTDALVAVMKTAPKDVHGAADAMGQLNAIVGAGKMHMDDLVGALRSGVLVAAKGAGLGLRDVGAALDVMTQRGTPAQEAATRLRMTFALLASPTGKAADVLKSIGIDQLQLATDLRKPNGLLVAVRDLKQHLDASGKSASEQNQLIVQAFGGGRSSATIQTLLQNVNSLTTAYGANKDGVKSLEDANAAFEQTNKAKLEKSLGELQVTAIKLGTDVLPVVVPVIKDIGHGVSVVTHAFEDLPKPIRDAAIGLAAFGAVVGPIAIAIGGVSKGLGALGALGGRTWGVGFGAGAAETAGGTAAAGRIGTAIRGLKLGGGIVLGGLVAQDIVSGIVREIDHSAGDRLARTLKNWGKDNPNLLNPLGTPQPTGGGDKAKAAARDFQMLRDWILRTNRSAKELNDTLSNPGNVKNLTDDQIAQLKRLGRAIPTVQDNFARMRKGSVLSMSELRESVKENFDLIALAMGVRSKRGAQAVATNTSLAIRNIKGFMRDGVLTTSQGMREIERLFEQEAATFGITGNQARASAHIRAFDSAHGVDRSAGSGTSFNTGGRVPGPVGPDSVPLLAPGGGVRGIVAPGELLIANRHTEARADQFLNLHGTSLGALVAGETLPHDAPMQAFAKGGIFSVSGQAGKKPSGPSHYQRLIAAMNRVSAAHFPYNLGGGHEQPSHFEPFDCSGAVSYATQQAGYKVPTTVSGGMGSWPFPRGEGEVTIYYNGGHTFMRAGGRYWGTSGSWRPGGGAGWFTGRPGAGYLSGFQAIHLPNLGGSGGFGQVRPLYVHGPNGELRSVMQGSLDVSRKAANAQLRALEAASGGANHGQPLADGAGGGPWDVPHLEALWEAHKGPHRVAEIMGHVAIAESGGPGAKVANPKAINPQAVNGKHAEGLWQILGALVPGDLLDPDVNAENAVAKYKAAGLSPWASSRGLWGHFLGTTETLTGRGRAYGGRLPFYGAFGEGGSFTTDGPGYMLVGENGEEDVHVARKQASHHHHRHFRPHGRHVIDIDAIEEALAHGHITQRAIDILRQELRHFPHDRALHRLFRRAVHSFNQAVEHQFANPQAIADRVSRQIERQGWRDNIHGHGPDSRTALEHRLGEMAMGMVGLTGTRHALMRTLRSAQNHHNTALAKWARRQIHAIDDQILETRSDAHDIRKQIKAAIAAAREKAIHAVVDPLEHAASLAATAVSLVEQLQHNKGIDLAGFQQLKDKQGGFLTAAQQAQAHKSLVQFIGAVRRQEKPLQDELAYDRRILPSLHGQARRDMEQHIADLTLQLAQLEGTIKDATQSTADLTSATEDNTKATQEFSGQMTFEYQGQTEVISGPNRPQPPPSQVTAGSTSDGLLNLSVGV